MRSWARWTAFPLALLACAVTGGCGSETSDGELVVAVSVLPHAGLVGRIAGPSVRVVTLVRPGESPSTHQPTDAQVSEVLRAKVYFRTGVPFERGSWLGLLKQASDLEIVDLREGVPLREIEGHTCAGPGHDHDHDRDHLDPHIWLEPACLAIQAKAIAEALVDVDPARADRYRARLAEVEADLKRLDETLREVLAPVEGGVLYVFHPAWGYLCDAYGLVQRTIEIEGKEPSEAELTDLITSALTDRVRVIFVQSQITGATAKAIANTVHADLRPIDPLARDVVGNLESVAREFAEALK